MLPGCALGGLVHSLVEYINIQEYEVVNTRIVAGVKVTEDVHEMDWRRKQKNTQCTTLSTSKK